MNILYVWSDQSGEFNCSWHRMINPALALRRAGHPVELIHCNEWQQNTPHALKVTESADLILFQRNAFGAAVGCLMDWLSRGKKIAIDVDDSYHHMTETTGSPTWELWRRGRWQQDGKQYEFSPVLPLQSLETSVKLCGHLTAPSHVLCEDWQPYANTHCIPNYIDTRIYKVRSLMYKQPGKVYLGWGGSKGHLPSWKHSGIIPALNEIVREFPNVMILTAGEDGLGRDLKVSPSRRTRIDWVDPTRYADFLGTLDVGLIPLSGEYDRRRSCLKSLEYTCVGLPWLGSDLEPNRSISTGTLVQNTPEAWYVGIKDYLTNLESLKQRALIDRAVTDEWNVDARVPCLLEKYAEILEL